MIKAGIIGATGYAGNELVRILMGHKEVEIIWYGSRSFIDKKFADNLDNQILFIAEISEMRKAYGFSSLDYQRLAKKYYPIHNRHCQQASLPRGRIGAAEGEQHDDIGYQCQQRDVPHQIGGR